MARKNLLASVTATLNAQNDAETSNAETRASYTKRGASRSMMQSLDDLAENSLRMLDGETVVMIEPSELDGSFIADRIGEDDEEYTALREAIRQSGQSTPILVRPHPDDHGRFMIVFGHRRAKVARDLGIKVRAVIKPLADIEHVIAQGQENTARADLSFIEKALFARRLLQSGMSKDVIKTALTVDDTLLSRMLSVADVVPDDVLEALGAAKNVGRDRWEDLKKTVLNPAICKLASDIVATDDFKGADDKFVFLTTALKSKGRGSRKSATSTSKTAWAPAGKSVSVTTKAKSKTMELEFSEARGKAFATWISTNLDDLFSLFEADGSSSQSNTGD